MAEVASQKIYILDIQVKEQSGIDIARQIRKTDTDSVIIFLTAYGELSTTVANDELMCLTYINKFDNSYNRIKSAIEKSLNIMNKKSVIRFNDHGVVYSIPTKDILFITRDSIERKSVIKTDYSQFKISKTLIELLEILGNPFSESHRACIINMDRVRIIDRKKKLITFDSGVTTDLISPNFKMEVDNNVRNI